MLWKAIWVQKRIVIYTMVAGKISGLTAVALFAQSGFLISKAALMPPFYTILILAAFLKLFGVAKSTSKYAERLLSHRITFQLMSHIRESYFAALLQQTALFDRYRKGYLLQRITTDVEKLQHFFLRVAYPPLVATLVFIVTILFSSIFSWPIALLLMFGFIVTTLLIPYGLAKLAQPEPTDLQASLSSKLTEYIYGYETLLFYHQLYIKEQEILQLSKQYSLAQAARERHMQRAHLANQFIALAVAFIVLLIGASAVVDGQLQGVYLAMLLMVTLTVFELVTPLANTPNYIASTNTALNRLQHFTAKHDGKQSITSLFPIQFHDVSVRYDETLMPAVRNISFTIQQGEKIAIIGPSGSGKTSIFQLLMKETLATTGDITLQYKPLASIADDALFIQMSIQLQHNHFFAGTVRENLQLAKPDATDDEMLHVLTYVQLSQKLDDSVQEQAANFSGGERQRLAYARVLLQNAPCFILDEPFASMDMLLKKKFIHDLCNFSNTVLLISHEPHALEHFDRIFTMSNGQLYQNKRQLPPNH